MAFIIAALIFVATLLVCISGLMAANMSASPSATNEMLSNIPWWFVGGTIFALAIAATHWVVHVSWW